MFDFPQCGGSAEGVFWYKDGHLFMMNRPDQARHLFGAGWHPPAEHVLYRDIQVVNEEDDHPYLTNARHTQWVPHKCHSFHDGPRCRREGRVGHEWTVWMPPEPPKGGLTYPDRGNITRWADRAELQKLADHTIRVAYGKERLLRTRGLQSPWVPLLHEMELIKISQEDLDVLDEIHKEYPHE